MFPSPFVANSITTCIRRFDPSLLLYQWCTSYWLFMRIVSIERELCRFLKANVVIKAFLCPVVSSLFAAWELQRSREESSSVEPHRYVELLFVRSKEWGTSKSNELIYERSEAYLYSSFAWWNCKPSYPRRAK